MFLNKKKYNKQFNIYHYKNLSKNISYKNIKILNNF